MKGASFLLCILWCGSSFAQSQNVFEPSRFKGTIELDGKLDDEQWQSVSPIVNFMQAFPKLGTAPTERTSAKIIYNDEYLYIGITCYDSVPEKIVATGMERDVFYGGDDGIGIVLDTYNDKRQGIAFFTNPLAARFDEEFLSNGDAFNAAYNTFWNVKTHRGEFGYSVEFQIPFSSLRFEQRAETVMEFKLIRYIRHKNEYNIFPPCDPMLPNLIWRVNSGQEIVFRNLNARTPFYFTPYAKFTYNESKDPNSSNTALVKTNQFFSRNNYVSSESLDKALSSVGGDVKYGLSKNFTLDATVNTDFAQAEADNRIINLTRFDVLLPEKRNFFLESKDYLSFNAGPNVLVFNSRTVGIEKGKIIPVVGGLRLTGKSNGLQLGVLSVQTNGLASSNIDQQNISVFRARRELFKNGSFIGGIFTNRVSTNGDQYSNQVVAIDFVRRYGQKWMTGFNLSASNDKATPGFFNQSNKVDLFLFKFANVGYNSTNVAEYAGKNFHARSGFSPDSAFASLYSYHGYTWQVKEMKGINYFSLNALISGKHRLINNILESYYLATEVVTLSKSGSTVRVSTNLSREYIPYDWKFNADQTIPVGFYYMRGLKFGYDSKQTSRFYYSLSYQPSLYYGGSRQYFLGQFNYAMNKYLRVNCNYELNDISFPIEYSATNTSKYQTNLLYFGLTYTQSIYFSIKLLSQYDDISRTVGGNLRIRYNPREGTDLYIVYNPRINTALRGFYENDPLVVDRQVFIIKFSKALSL